MNESNELNDIILNKGTAANNNKKIILAVATLGVILIVVVMLMNSLTSNGTENLPQTPIPPKAKASKNIQEEALFEEVEVLEENTNNDNLSAIASRLKEESQEQAEKETPVLQESKKEETVVQKPVTIKPKTVITPKVSQKEAAITTSSSTSEAAYYIQVGSFSKYAPNKKFLKSITDLGYTYKFHKIIKSAKTLNKVLVGPFKTSDEAKNARRVLRAKVEPGAFLTKL